MKTTLRLLMLAIVPLMLTSCFSTRYVSNEAELQRDYMGRYAEDIEFTFGKPNKVEENQRGYSYIYNQQGRVWKSKKMVDQYMRFSFDNEDAVRNVQSTTTRRAKRFSAWKTFGLPSAIVGGLVIVPIAILAASEI